MRVIGFFFLLISLILFGTAKAGPMIEQGEAPFEEALFSAGLTHFGSYNGSYEDAPELFLGLYGIDDPAQQDNGLVNYGRQNKLSFIFAPARDFAAVSVIGQGGGGGIYISALFDISEKLQKAGFSNTVQDIDTIQFSIWNEDVASAVELSDLKINGLGVPGFEDLFVSGNAFDFYAKGIDFRDPPRVLPYLPAIFRLEFNITLNGDFSNEAVLSGLELDFGITQQAVEVSTPGALGLLSLGLCFLGVQSLRRRSA